MSSADGKIEVENINTPGRTTRLDKTKYMAMRLALLKALPSQAPGVSVADAHKTLLEHLSQGVFPNGSKSMWWFKAVQLDLEAKGIIKRAAKKPVHLYRVVDAA